MGCLSILCTALFIFSFLSLAKSQTHRQVSFENSPGKQEISSAKTKLDLKHIFHLGSPQDLHQGGTSLPDGNVFKLMTVPQASQKTQNTQKEIDFQLLQKHIDTGGLMAFESPNENVLRLRKSILNLAKMAEHAYDPLPSTPWEDMEPGWHVNTSFGWNEKSVRGYVFSDQDSKVLIISFKGTTLTFLPGDGGATVPRDKESDNLMFSCCYGDAMSWTQKDSCSLGNNICSQGCLEDHINANTTYYHGAQLIYDAVVTKYGHENIMLVGHSLGGSLAALVGLANKKPAFTFEAPGEKLYAHRLGIDSTENDRKPYIFHHGHNADPLFLGTW
ncbi:putative lipase atg15, variant 2 [Entomophthora muscae]|uniref:Lipase atg15, variant 2 n=1 Tax=Entomophthora muscae TaxID=34485 RepID=A0ACC2S0A4_9FUNG|nr:putative lipase atg15, variant 2 [Entomophthora muscae]